MKVNDTFISTMKTFYFLHVMSSSDRAELNSVEILRNLINILKKPIDSKRICKFLVRHSPSG